MAAKKKAGQKLITIAEATTALQWLHGVAARGAARNDRKQAMVVIGLIRGLETVVEFEEKRATRARRDIHPLRKRANVQLGSGKY